MKQSFKNIRLRVLETLSNPWILATTILMVIALIVDLSPIGGNLRLYTKWTQCGQKPVAASSFMNDMTYYDPPFYTPIQLFKPEYYCTSKQAEAAGYSPDISYELHQ